MELKPFKTEGRNCFGIHYFISSTEAHEYSSMVIKRGDCYNGGMYDGMACGRETRFDHIDDQGRQL